MFHFRYILLFIVFIYSISVSATAVSPWINIKEKGSFYNSWGKRVAVKGLYKQVSKNALELFFHETFNEPVRQEMCSFTVVKTLRRGVEHIEKGVFKNRKRAVIYALRKTDLIDDVVAKILLEASKTAWRRVNKFTFDVRIKSIQKPKKILSIYNIFKKHRKRGDCLSTNWRSLYMRLRVLKKDLSNRDLRKFNVLAYKKGVLSKKGFVEAERARRGKVHTWKLTLREYAKKIAFLQKHYPARELERSKYVTKKTKVQKRLLKRQSLRQKLFKNFDGYQIAIMGNIIKKLRKRMDSPRTTITIYDRRDKASEILTLTPMERYRFCLKLLRKEMELLKNSIRFRGTDPSYKLIIVAAFEIGLVPALEVDQIAKLELTWSPLQTPWQKALYWIKSFGTIATSLIPPPYGFIGVLALVGLEIATPRKKIPARTHSLF